MNAPRRVRHDSPITVSHDSSAPQPLVQSPSNVERKIALNRQVVRQVPYAVLYDIAILGAWHPGISIRRNDDRTFKFLNGHCAASTSRIRRALEATATALAPVPFQIA
jgi:hypothetical protein